MAYYHKITENEKMEMGKGHGSFKVLSEEQGCTNGCCAGISFYPDTEYNEAGVHDDQEGFLVLAGSGSAKIGDEEFKVEKDMVFVAPKGVPHQLKADCSAEPLKVFWFHAQA